MKKIDLNKMRIEIPFWNKNEKVYHEEIYDLDNFQDINDFLSKSQYGYHFKKIARIEKSSIKASGYNVLTNENYENKSGVIYILTINGKIIKIGESGETLKERFASYSAGTEKNRESGTSSTTNYIVSRTIRSALMLNSKIELYAYEPFIPIIKIMLGEKERSFDAVKDTAKKIENLITEDFISIYGNKPILSLNHKK
jgi:hypothetical protein